MVIKIEDEKKSTEEGKNNQLEEYIDHLQRLQAEFQNYKKRVEKEQRELSSRAKGNLIKHLLPIVDDFERLIDSTTETNDGKLSEGARMIYEKLMNVLKEQGLEPLSVVGQDFDPHLHEAVSVDESPPELDGKVLEEWQRGYLFNGELLRPAKVKVGKNPSAINCN